MEHVAWKMSALLLLLTPIACLVPNQALTHRITFYPYKSLLGENYHFHFTTEDTEIQHIYVSGPKFLQLGSGRGRIWTLVSLVSKLLFWVTVVISQNRVQKAQKVDFTLNPSSHPKALKTPSCQGQHWLQGPGRAGLFCWDRRINGKTPSWPDVQVKCSSSEDQPWKRKPAPSKRKMSLPLPLWSMRVMCVPACHREYVCMCMESPCAPV